MARFDVVTKPNPNQVPFDFLVPSSDWTPPTELPDLVAQGVRRVGLDSEERDDGLAADWGAGWATNAGYICGVGVAWEGGSVYAPTRHPDTENLPQDNVRRWLKYMIDNGVTFVTQHGSYDWGWLGTPGWDLRVPPEQVEDAYAAAVMLDENRLSYGLDALCAWQGLPGKDERLLQEAGSALGLGPKLGDVKKNLWRLPARFVGPYGAQDPASTLALLGRLEPQLEAQQLMEAYRLEAEILPLTVDMRRRGIRMDTARAEEALAELSTARDAALKAAGEHYKEGRDLTISDVLSPRFLERAFTDLGLTFTRTAKAGQGSFTSDWLDLHPHPFAGLVSNARYYQMIADKFIRGFILDYCHRGRLHAEIHQLRDADDDGSTRGTRSYRFSYADPPLQQQPNPKRSPPGSPERVKARNKAAGTLIRSCFLPDEGRTWGRADWSQQEYRLMVHYAELLHLDGATSAGERYRADPKTDFHSMVAELTGLPRPEAKDVNFAQSYGAGLNKFALMTGRSLDESKRIREQYDTEMPFIKQLAEKSRQWADRRGYVRLIDGARCRFDLWEPGWGYEGTWFPPVSKMEADARVATDSGHPWEGHRLKRAFTHKAMNRIIQGSAARQCKRAMRELWREGVVPLLQLHDELDFDFIEPGTPVLVKTVMETCIKTTVPMLADVSTGPSWGECAD